MYGTTTLQLYNNVPHMFTHIYVLYIYMYLRQVALWVLNNFCAIFADNDDTTCRARIATAQHTHTHTACHSKSQSHMFKCINVCVLCINIATILLRYIHTHAQFDALWLLSSMWDLVYLTLLQARWCCYIPIPIYIHLQ